MENIKISCVKNNEEWAITYNDLDGVETLKVSDSAFINALSIFLSELENSTKNNCED